MARKYHYLIERDDESDTWAIVFGDYDRSCVAYEQQYMRGRGIRAKHLRIVSCVDDRPASYNVAMLNTGLKFYMQKER